MTAIQLDLFPQEAMMAAAPATGLHPAFINLHDIDGRVCARVTIDSTLTLDPCRSCPLHELCGADDCGQKLYEIDDDTPNYASFEEWASDPLW